MKVEKFKEYVLEYSKYANATDVHVNPTKGVSSGAHGRFYELLIKVALNNCRSNGVSKAGRVDTKKKIDGRMTTIEIKTNAGELVCIDALGQVYSDIRDCDIVIYAPEYYPIQAEEVNEIVIDSILQSYVMTGQEFWCLACRNGLIRWKKSSHKDTVSFRDFSYDRLTLKSFTPAQLAHWKNELEENATPLADWLIENGMNYVGL